MSLTTVPLRFSQKTRLVAACLPFPFFAAAVAFYYLFWVDFASSMTRQPIDTASGRNVLFAALMALVLAWTGREALHALRDLKSGVAIVAEDRLMRVWGRGRFKRATFETLGRVRLTRWGGAPGQQHRVLYSPATKIVWDATPL
jgi:hypothetical protein